MGVRGFRWNSHSPVFQGTSPARHILGTNTSARSILRLRGPPFVDGRLLVARSRNTNAHPANPARPRRLRDHLNRDTGRSPFAGRGPRITGAKVYMPCVEGGPSADPWDSQSAERTPVIISLQPHCGPSYPVKPATTLFLPCSVPEPVDDDLQQPLGRVSAA